VDTPAGGAPARGASRRRALAALCVTEIVSYGVLYYAFPVLAGDISASTGWSRTAITAAFSAGNLTGALTGVLAGRLIDRLGPRPVMTAGSVLAAVAVAGIAMAPAYGWFVAAWLLAGVAMAGVFYPPAFAALTGWYGPDHVRALTALTLAAGFASTIFAPLTATLGGHLGWRTTYLVLAAILAAVTIPAHALTLRLPWDSPPRTRAATARRRGVLASRTFLLLVSSMTLSAFALYAVIFTLIPLLTGRGLSPPMAAWRWAWVEPGRSPGACATGRWPPAPGCAAGSWRSRPPEPSPPSCWPCCPDRQRCSSRHQSWPARYAACSRCWRRQRSATTGGQRVRLAERRVQRAAHGRHRDRPDNRRSAGGQRRRIPGTVHHPGRRRRTQRRTGPGR
jgi:MFS family permease